jgi:hypothetical protein
MIFVCGRNSSGDEDKDAVFMITNTNVSVHETTIHRNQYKLYRANMKAV